MYVKSNKKSSTTIVALLLLERLIRVQHAHFYHWDRA